MSSRTAASTDRSVTEVTRRSIIDTLALEPIAWNGDLNEVEFLGRLFDLDTLPSYDHRYRTASRDIWQHRVFNFDWDDNWVFTDARFDLLHGPDEVFLRFLAEMVHPVVRRNPGAVSALVEMLNAHLAADGWELAERMTISGRPVYAARQALGCKLTTDSARIVAQTIGADYIHRQITRLEAAIDSDPDLAIGTAKEFVETVCKTILDERHVEYDVAADFPKLVRVALKTLQLAPATVGSAAPDSSDSIRLVLSSLATVSNGMAELRNRLGTGHGRSAAAQTARPRHARLAVGAATTLAVFLFETHQERFATEK